MDKKRLAIIAFITLLIGGNVLFAILWVSQKSELPILQQQINSQQTNTKVIAFAELFVEKVLKGTGEIDFEDRLKLENSVRDINDEQIFNQWQKFVKSANSKDVQKEASDLLAILLDKINK